MIKSIKHKGLKRLWEQDDESKLNAGHIDKIRMILLTLEVAATIEDMKRPSFNLHELKELNYHQ